jgi:hypothetical protein
MNLPDDIEVQILDYLRLEYGEDAGGPAALQRSQLRYEGEYLLNGVATHFWWFPCTTQQCWATVEPWEDSYCLGMTTECPASLERV